MTLPLTYSRRQRLSAGDTSDVYKYDFIPSHLRVQVLQIIGDGIGEYWLRGARLPNAKYYDAIVKSLCRELGIHRLVANPGHDKRDELFSWMQVTNDVDAWLDALEMSLLFIDTSVRSREKLLYQPYITRSADEIISELNARMLESGMGYQYISRQIVRLDSKYIHNTIIVPALMLLEGAAYSEANQNYRNAQDSYRRGKFRECLSGCCAAVENVLRAIGNERGWKIGESDPPGKLVQVAVDVGFITVSSQPALGSLLGVVAGSVAVARARPGERSPESPAQEIGRDLAALQLHQTAAMLLYLAEHHALQPASVASAAKETYPVEELPQPWQRNKAVHG